MKENMIKDYYKIMELKEDCSQEDIKLAYRKLAKQFHPDVSKEPSAEEKFKEISEAYSILGDETKRKQYNQRKNMGEGYNDWNFAGKNSPFSADFSSDFFNFFREPRKTRSRDMRIEIKITLAEVMSGCDKTISLNRNILCKKCKGTGAKDEKSVGVCNKCNGRGQTVVENNHGMFQFQQRIPCQNCLGRGKVILKACSECSGNKTIEINENIRFSIPKGIDENSVIKITGHGEDTKDIPGDLYIYVVIEEDPIFEKNNKDLIATVSIPLLTALIGGEYKIKNPLGEIINVPIPKACQHDSLIKIPFKGIEKGDLIVKIKITIPILSEEKMQNISSILESYV